MPFFETGTSAPALNDCGCGCGGQQKPQQLSNGYHRRAKKKRRGLNGLSSDDMPERRDAEAAEIKNYLATLRQQLKVTPSDYPEQREKIKQEIRRYKEELRKINGGESSSNSGDSSDSDSDSDSDSEESFFTKDSIISGVPNWGVLLGGAVVAYGVYELAT